MSTFCGQNLRILGQILLPVLHDRFLNKRMASIITNIMVLDFVYAHGTEYLE